MSNKNLLILSPHPDDDVIGMGGTIANKLIDNFNVDIIYVTNGLGSIKTKQYSNLDDNQFIKLREEEAKLSLKIITDNLKINIEKVTQIFLKYNSSDLKNNNSQFKTYLLNQTKKKEYSEIYCTSNFERHLTHIACSNTIKEVIDNNNLKIPCYGYEVWSPVPFEKAEIVNNITPYIQLKNQAILAHKSQLSITSFNDGIIGKNRYNGVFSIINSNKHYDYAELFSKL